MQIQSNLGLITSAFMHTDLDNSKGKAMDNLQLESTKKWNVTMKNQNPCRPFSYQESNSQMFILQ